MEYKKPEIVAQDTQGVFAAECPQESTGGVWDYDNCRICERTH